MIIPARRPDTVSRGGGWGGVVFGLTLLCALVSNVCVALYAQQEQATEWHAQDESTSKAERITFALVKPFTIIPGIADPRTYDRKQWKHWTDADDDCMDARHEVLFAESTTPPQLDERGCRVIAGTWPDPYTGMTLTDPRDLQVDHVVALGWAFYHGGWAWDNETRERYANDLDHPEHLVAVFGPVNQSKGRLGPDQWRPENPQHWCEFGRSWRDITARWGLMLTWDESAAVQQLLATCPRMQN